MTRSIGEEVRLASARIRAREAAAWHRSQTYAAALIRILELARWDRLRRRRP